jgi:hypothetical protein
MRIQVLWVSAVVLFSLYSCGTNKTDVVATPSPSNNNQSYHIDSVPYGGELVIIGVSSLHTSDIRQRDETYKVGQESIDAALKDAARKVSMYATSVSGMFRNKMDITTSIFDYVNETEQTVTYNEEYESYIQGLVYDPASDVFVENHIVFVKARYPMPDFVSVPFEPTKDNGKPAWIDAPPEKIGEYFVGVGFANPRQYPKDSIIASYENAVLDLVRRAGDTKVVTVWTDDGEGHFESMTESSARLTEFYVLEVWMDEKGTMGSVYTLAIAKRFGD